MKELAIVHEEKTIMNKNKFKRFLFPIIVDIFFKNTQKSSE